MRLDAAGERGEHSNRRIDLKFLLDFTDMKMRWRSSLAYCVFI